MTRRWPLWLSLLVASSWRDPRPPTPLPPIESDREPGPLHVVMEAPPALTSRPLSWDREDEAVSAGECPWCPALDFPDHTALLRHVVMHARTWEAEALHSERLRRAMVGRVQRYARDVVERANELGSRT